MNLRLIFSIGLALLALVGAIIWMGANQPATDADLRGDPSVDVGGPFSLTSDKGEAITHETLLGKPSLIYFGFTSCPDICPTELTKITAALDDLNALGIGADQLDTVFITVDPERDTVSQMRDYLGLFHPDIMGLTGSPEAVQQALDEYRVFSQKVPSGDSYTMNHTSIIYLMDGNGHYVTHFTMDDPAEEIVAKVQRLVG